MRLLVFHADSFAFDTPDRTETGAEPTAPAGECEDCLAVFATVETGDTTATDAVVANACEEILAVTDQLRTDSVVLYPSASLGDDPAPADEAAGVLAALGDALAAERDVLRAPADRNTGFELAAKGHPFAEGSRRVTPADGRGDTADRGAEWEVALPDGATRSPSEFLDGASGTTDAADPARETRQALVERLDGGSSRAVDSENTIDDSGEYGTAVRDSGLVDAAAGTTGTPQLTPRGTFVRDAIAEYARAEAIAAGAVPVETGTVEVRSPGDDAGGASPSVVRSVPRSAPKPRVAPAVLSALERAREAAGSDPARVYRTATEAVPADGSQRGERAATVPELWSTTAGLAAARAELTAQAALVRRIAGALALETVPVLRATAAFASQHGAWLDRLVDALGEPVPVDRRLASHSWPVTLAFVTVVAGRAVETGSIWLAPGDGGAGWQALDSGGGPDGEGAGWLLCCRPVGSLERATATAGARAATRDPPRLPTWLAPTQVRLVPTDPDVFGGHCHDVADRLDAAGIRVDVDDSHRAVGERLDRADADWVPYDAVVGRPEAAGEPLEVTVRETGAATELTVAELRERVLADVGDRPRKRQYLPRSVRDQPTVSRE